MTSEALKAKALTTIEKALDCAKKAGADEAAASMGGGRNGLTRFARNAVIQNVEKDTNVLTLAVAVGNREAGLTTDVLDDDSICQLAKNAVELAKMYPENPEHTGPVEPKPIAEVCGFDEDTSEYPQDEKINRIQSICEKTAKENLHAFGTLTTGWKYKAIGNSLGHMAWHPESIADFSLTIRTEDGEGSCRENRGYHCIDKIEFEELRERCTDWAKWSTEAEYLDPGEYKVILTPTAALNYMIWAFFTLGARKVHEKRSSLVTHFGVDNPLGAKLFSEKISAYSRVSLADCPCSPFNPAIEMDGWGGQGIVSSLFGNGLPVEEYPIIENGVVKHLFSSLYWARKTNQQPRAFPSLIEIPGTEKSLKQIVEETDKAILVNSFWYIRFVDTNHLLLTGLTRDGVFWVENGKIVKPLKNLRFNESPLISMTNVLDVGRPQLRKTWMDKALVPPMVVDNFSFTNETDAI